MPNELRVRANALGGIVEDNPLTAAATTLTSSGLAAAPVIGTTQHLVVVLDPDGLAGAPEIAHITAHTDSASTATILRGQEGTTAREHARDTYWIHGPTVKDYDGSAGGSGLIGYTTYRAAAAQYTLAQSATTPSNIDATNLKITFVAPPSGKVLVRLTGSIRLASDTYPTHWSLINSATSTEVTGVRTLVAFNISYGQVVMSVPMLATGLTPGTQYTLNWAGMTWTGGTAVMGINNNDSLSAFTMEAWAVNV